MTLLPQAIAAPEAIAVPLEKILPYFDFIIGRIEHQ